MDTDISGTKKVVALWEGKHWADTSIYHPIQSPERRVTYVQASAQFLFPMSPSCHMGLNILELIASPIQPVPVQGLLVTSTCSTLFSLPFPRFSSIHPTYNVPRFCSKWLQRISVVPLSCPHCPGGVRAQREDKRGIWTIIPLLILPIILCYHCTCSPKAPPLLLSLPFSPRSPCYHFSSPYCYFTYIFLHSLLKRFPSLLPFRLLFWSDVAVLVRKWNTALEETFQGHLCDIFRDTHALHMEETPGAMKALRLAWQIKGVGVILVPQRWLRRRFCYPVFMLVFVSVCVCV